MNSRTIAIGDIHGCSAALDALIEAMRPGREDCIVTLGDYVNRGPDSRGVIERLIDLLDHRRGYSKPGSSNAGCRSKSDPDMCGPKPVGQKDRTPLYEVAARVG
jgi:hypothetical protein